MFVLLDSLRFSKLLKLYYIERRISSKRKQSEKTSCDPDLRLQDNRLREESHEMRICGNAELAERNSSKYSAPLKCVFLSLIERNLLVRNER